MNQIVINDGHNKYVRISKVAARKRFIAAEPVYIIAHKMRPGYPFSMGMQMGNSPEHIERGFDKIIQDFYFYNCTYETGYYPAFYIETHK